jgi:hypothetical protein
VRTLAPGRRRPRSRLPVRASYHLAEVAAMEVWLLVGDHVRFDVAERRVGLVLDTVVEGLDDVLLESRRAREGGDDRFTFNIRIFRIGKAEHVHLDARCDQCHDRVHMDGNARRRVQRDGRPYRIPRCV